MDLTGSNDSWQGFHLKLVCAAGSVTIYLSKVESQQWVPVFLLTMILTFCEITKIIYLVIYRSDKTIIISITITLTITITRYLDGYM